MTKDTLLKELSPVDKTPAEAQEASVCSWCNGVITGFKDRLSSKEYGISGMCQECQDDVFGSAEGM